ncbi:MAG: hypothetical protein JWL72_928 [Ilumatobacteraceae bacterium]|nr:hypothetical protein [Ilumatobacteraceae bacterium]MCU1387590.1 hypothetical protein [Ilumatobacteraceae bacterium]
MTATTIPTADMQLESPRETQNWRPFVNWVLAIPHLVIANALGNVANLLSVISWFSIVFTGRMPDGIAQFQCTILRYEARAYSYVAFLRRPYPQFEFDTAHGDNGNDPLRVDFAPQPAVRNRVTVAFRIILIIPVLIYTALVVIAATLAVIAAAFAVLFTGRWPQGLRSFVLDAGRLTLRVSAYGRLLTDTYPSFALSAPGAA